MLPKVSIIVPVYNAAAYLPVCLRSLCGQTLQEIEIILVDDGSTDESGTLCDTAARQDGRVRVLHQDNKGSTEARKAGLRLAGAGYVTFVDADDWAEPELCESLYNAVEASGADIAIGAHFLEQDGRPSRRQSCLPAGVYNRKRLEREILPVLFHNDFHKEWTVWPYLCGKLFRREQALAWQEAVAEGIRLGEDACVTFPCIVQARSLVLLNSPLYHYVQRGGGQFHARLDEEDLWRTGQIFRQVAASFQGLAQEQALLVGLRTYLLTTILLPRSPWLLPGMENEDVLFPFRDVERGSRVIIYGAGVFGTSLHDFLMRTHFALVVLWLDARAARLREQGLDVLALGEIGEWPQHDYVLIPIMQASTVEDIMADLAVAGVAREKMRCLDETYAISEAVWQRFGLEKG